jgi:hypothetical protein
MLTSACRRDASKQAVSTHGPVNQTHAQASAVSLHRADSAHKAQSRHGQPTSSTQPTSVSSSPQEDAVKPAPPAAATAAAAQAPLAINGTHHTESTPRSPSASPRHWRHSQHSAATHDSTGGHHDRDRDRDRELKRARSGGEADGEEDWEMQNAQDLDPQAFLRNLAEQQGDVPADDGGGDGAAAAPAPGEPGEEDEYHKTMQQARRRGRGLDGILAHAARYAAMRGRSGTALKASVRSALCYCRYALFGGPLCTPRTSVTPCVARR